MLFAISGNRWIRRIKAILARTNSGCDQPDEKALKLDT
jgi:hypothetical protein